MEASLYLCGDRDGLKLRGVAQLARAAVSKTAGRAFESLHPCQALAFPGRQIEL